MHTAYNSKIPLVIVIFLKCINLKSQTKKLYKRDPENDKGFNFLVCVDGSKKSYKCLNIAVQLAFDKNDKIMICYAPIPEKAKFASLIEMKITEYMENVQRNWEFQVLKPTYKNTREIINFINYNE